MSRLTYIGVAILVLVASAAIVSWALKSGPSKPVTTTTQPTPSAQTKEDSTVKLPVKLSNSAVKNTSITYTFTANIKEMKSDLKGLILLTTINGIKGDGIPEQFLITPEAIIYFTNNGKKTNTTSASLAVGQTVDVIASYNLAKKKWKTSRVGIVVTQTPSTASPSANQ